MHVLRDAGRRVQGDRGPYGVDICLRDPMPLQEIPRRIGAVDLEAFIAAALRLGQTHVMEHRTRIEQFRIEFRAAMLTHQRGEQEDAARMIEEQVRLGVADNLRHLLCELAVGDSSELACNGHGAASFHGFLEAQISSHFVKTDPALRRDA
jgi:hypothetical protein